ncbi:glycoside hydrolase family 43 protein [Sanguibacter suaedae]|uniref:Glycoside hydrolase family 43 protein n=1 Tax=Sanguibacter suaedae TaxID=2795737 RepID=A0A934I963_9MICO|nr:glycoside hydrolase family 43 protein [Sanguibacter suaedae]MBI9113520.1 glycoside hydrolase family 43 protein [Sanguibacter suaedae]
MPPCNDAQRSDAGYLMVFHSDETHAIHAILSEGPDPTRWRSVDGGDPVVTSSLGEKGTRDPHLVRSPVDGKYFLLGTDLDIRWTDRPGVPEDGFWDWVGRHGSRSINVWESVDLVTWSEQRQVEVAPATAGMAWAPKTVWDDDADAFLVVWSSRVFAADDTDHAGDGPHRLLAAHTRDFVTFTPAQDWGNPGASVIDAFIVQDDEGFVRFVKDEAAGTVLSEQAASLHAERWEPVSAGVASGTETGIIEGPLVFRSFTDGEWYLWVDEYTGADRGYVPFHSPDLRAERWAPVEGYSFPCKVKHGTVVPLDADQYARLEARVR